MKPTKSIFLNIAPRALPVVKRVACLTGTVAVLAALANPAGGATTLANWGYENTGSFYPNTGSNTNSTTPPNFAPDSSYNSNTGEVSAAGGFTGTPTFSSPAGNGSLHALGANMWNAGAYFQFTVNTVGATALNITYDQTGSGSGPRDFILQYSTNGTTFTNVGNVYAVALATWNTTVPNTTVPDTQSYNLSAITSLENNSLDYFRVLDTDAVNINGGAVATAGSDRVDNFLVSGTVAGVPEPATLFGGLLLAGMAFFFWARRVAANGNEESAHLPG